MTSRMSKESYRYVPPVDSLGDVYEEGGHPPGEQREGMPFHVRRDLGEIGRSEYFRIKYRGKYNFGKKKSQ